MKVGMTSVTFDIWEPVEFSFLIPLVTAVKQGFIHKSEFR